MTARQTPAVPVDRRYLWTVADLAAMLGCDPSTIRLHLYNGAGEKVTATDAVEGDTSSDPASAIASTSAGSLPDETALEGTGGLADVDGMAGVSHNNQPPHLSSARTLGDPAMTRRNSFTVYDKNDQSTWPPGAGQEVLVCYQNQNGFFSWTVEWSDKRPSDETALALGYGADWADTYIQNSSWVAWRLLDPETDAPDYDTAILLAGYYDLETVAE